MTTVIQTWGGEYLLGYFNRQIGRTGADSITDTTKYHMLSEAQNQVIADIAAIAPHVLYPTVAYGSIPTLITTDNQVYTFGADSLGNGYLRFPMGKSGIFTSLDDIPTNPLIEGVDYMNEGTQIRALNNGTLPDTLYWYGASQPIDIGVGSRGNFQEPSLLPEASRELIGIRAAYNFGTEGNRNAALSQAMAVKYGYPLAQNPGRFAFWMLTIRTQFARGGAIRTTGMSMAIAGQYGQAAWSA